MRTTVTFEPDTAAAVDAVRHERGVGMSAAVNELVRRGMATSEPPPTFIQRTSPGGARLDLTDIADTLDVLDGPAAR
ncbi:MAG: CopG family transcriptional regulator [Dermatophilaceae bacterium]